LYAFLLSPCVLHVTPITILLDLMTAIALSEEQVHIMKLFVTALSTFSSYFLFMSEYSQRLKLAQLK